MTFKVLSTDLKVIYYAQATIFQIVFAAAVYIFLYIKKPTDLDLSTNFSKIYGCFFPRVLVTSNFINLLVPNITMVFQYVESTLHTSFEAASDHGPTTNGLSTIFLSLIMMIVTATWLYAY